MKAGIGIFAAVFIAIGIFVFYTASFFPPSSHGVYGPGFFPKALALILILLSILLVVTDKEKSDRSLFFTADTIRVYKTMCFLGLYLVLINLVGFVCVTPFFLIGFMRFLKFRKLSVTIFISIGVTLFLYIVFSMLLFVQLPKGLLF